MTDPLLALIAASTAFVGTHFALSHPLRAPIVNLVGENGFRGIYSLVALATLVWMVAAFRAVGPGADAPPAARSLPHHWRSAHREREAGDNRSSSSHVRWGRGRASGRMVIHDT